MTTLLEAAQMALKALNTCDSSVGLAGERQWFDSNSVDRAIAALTTALAEQPTERKPLTYDELDVLWAKQQTRPFRSHGEDRMAFARAIEAAHGIRSLE